MPPKQPPKDLSIEGAEKKDGKSQGKAEFTIDTRSGNDRRQFKDRRKSIRFEDDRRKLKRRAEDRLWDDKDSV